MYNIKNNNTNLVGGIPMRQNDFFIIQYHILNHLYSSMKEKDTLPNTKCFSPDTYSINKKYFDRIVAYTYKNGLIDGLTIKGTLQPDISNTNAAYITDEGIRYLFVDPLMKEAKMYIDGEKEWDF